MNTVLLVSVVALVALVYWMTQTSIPTRGTCNVCDKYPSECSCYTDDPDQPTEEVTPSNDK